MDSKILEFVSRTGVTSSTARGILEKHDWNVNHALTMYNNLMQSKPYPGPPKNAELELANAAATTGGGGPIRKGLMDARTTGGNAPRPTTPDSPSTRSKLKRGLSKTNENLFLVHKARDIVLNDITERDDSPSSQETSHSQHFVDTPEYTFILPDLTAYAEDFKAFLHKDLIETSTLVSLEQAGRLNWWADAGIAQRLMPLATTGDGNCLLHAASLAMWGFHDRLLTLRTALFQNLTNSQSKGSLWRRWRWHQMQVNKQSGLVYTDKEWQVEWDNLLRLASNKPRTTPGSNNSCCNGPVTKGLMERVDTSSSNNTVETSSDGEAELFYESLEELHVFILAHVLRRPVIVVADTILKDSNGEALAPIPFGGIYLPLLCQPHHCHRSPLLLTYDASHFSALVAMEPSKHDEHPLPGAIPLVDPDLKLLPIHYMVDPGPDTVWGKHDNDPNYIQSLQLSTDQQILLIEQYLDVDRLCMTSHSSAHSTGDSSCESRSRANSLNSSVDSDENSVGSSASSKDKMKDKKGQKVARKLGSFGKSVGKQLRRKLAVAKKPSKSPDADRAKMPPPMYPPPRKPSGGGLTQSSRQSHLNNETGTSVLVTRLSDRRVKYQDELVYNYLQAAKERFKADRELKQLQEVEILARNGDKSSPTRGAGTPTVSNGVCDGIGGSGSSQLNNVANKNSLPSAAAAVHTQCINTDCTKIGSAVTSYLCQECFDLQRQEVLNIQKGAPMANSVKLPALNRHDTLFTTGKSKFYTDKEEAQTVKKAPPTAPKPNVHNSTGSGNKNSQTGATTTVTTKSTMFNNNINFNTVSPSSTTTHANNVELTRNNLNTGKTSHQRWGSAGTGGGSSTLPRDFRATMLDDDMKEPPPRHEVLTNSLFANGGRTVKVHSNVIIDKGVSNNVNSVNGLKNREPRNREPCKTKNCDFFGSDATDFLCSACYKEKQKTIPVDAQRHTKL